VACGTHAEGIGDVQPTAKQSKAEQSKAKQSKAKQSGIHCTQSIDRHDRLAAHTFACNVL
jgi:hypothetical protein